MRAGIRAQAAVRLFENSKTVGGLNLYSRQVGALDEVATISRLFFERSRRAATCRSQDRARAGNAYTAASRGRRE